MIPQDATGVAIVLSLIVPGFVYQVARRRFRGPTPDERDATARVLRAFAVSALLAFVYLAVFGRGLLDLRDDSGSLAEHPRGLAVLGVLLLFAVPAALAAAEQLVHVSTSPRDAWQRVRRRALTTYDPTPTAWDYCFTGREPGWLRVMTADGLWIGGWFGVESYASSYPEARELYIEQQYRMSDEGEFADEIPESAGVYVRCDDARVVEFIATGDASVGDGHNDYGEEAR